jgi:hypothetical protein
MGVPVTLSGRLTRAGVLIAAAAGAATLAAGCGSQVVTASSATKPASPSTASSSAIIPGGPRSSGGPDLCSEQASVTRLVVSRVSALPQNHLHFAFPAGITVRSPAQARAVAVAVCGLPAMPRGPMSCPADWGLSYRLSFAAGSRSFPVVTAAAGGCAAVTGAGPVRWTVRSPGFWTVLAHAMGVSAASALRGSVRAQPPTSPARLHASPVMPPPSPAR